MDDGLINKQHLNKKMLQTPVSAKVGFIVMAFLVVSYTLSKDSINCFL